jgi:hypothetical protein
MGGYDPLLARSLISCCMSAGVNYVPQPSVIWNGLQRDEGRLTVVLELSGTGKGLLVLKERPSGTYEGLLYLQQLAVGISTPGTHYSCGHPTAVCRPVEKYCTRLQQSDSVCICESTATKLQKVTLSESLIHFRDLARKLSQRCSA